MLILVIGGAGAGKSMVLAEMEACCGCRVYRTDDMAKALYHRGTAVFADLVTLFGQGILSEDGERVQPDRLAARVFTEGSEEKGKSQALIQVEALVHPAVMEQVEEISRRSRREDGLVVVETALPNRRFLEASDEVWYVYADEETRQERMMENRGYSRERAAKTIRTQHSDGEFREMADIVIDNSGTEERTAHEVYKHCERIQRERDLHRHGTHAHSGGCGDPNEGHQ